MKAFGAVLSQGATLATRERSLLLERRLDGLVGQIAERLMSTSSHTRDEILTWTMRTISESLSVSVAVLRRHDYPSELSVIEAQWPAPTVGDQMGSAAVPFAADPAMSPPKPGASRSSGNSGPESMHAPTSYRGGHCRGERPVAMTCVPLLGTGQPWGVLSLFHFGRRAWAPEELHMLQAVGALLMQMQARIDAEAQTLHNAVHDELTGLPNRRALLVQLTERLNDHKETAILFFDLDRFKVMNDYLGHASGDMILSTVAARIRSTIGPDDFAARLGGDEFVVLFSGMNSDKEAVGYAEQILGCAATTHRACGATSQSCGQRRDRPLHAGRDQWYGADRVG